MIQSYLKITILIAFISFSFQIIEFEVYQIDKYRNSCNEVTCEFNFIITGKFNSSVTSLNKIEIDLEISDGKKIKSKCSPKKNHFFSDEFWCVINVCVYSINKLDILLPTKPPQSDVYIFQEWEKTIGSEPGASNKFPAGDCLPKEYNTFIPSSITLGKCSLGQNSFSIYGDWENKDLSMPNVHLYDFHLLLDNENKNTSICNYKKTDPFHF